jgi:site-specific DNA-methyltransferase (adenine-specific)
LHANKRPLCSHENILIFAKEFKPSCYNPQKTPGNPYAARQGLKECAHYTTNRTAGTVNETGDRHPKSVLKFKNSRGGKSRHPTQKPLDLMLWLVNSYSNPGDVVADPFMGSGSTGVAAVQEGRSFIGCEKEQEYFQTASERIHAALAG